MNQTRTFWIIFLVFGAILSRLIPHAPNFTGIGAAAIFTGAMLNKRAAALPILALLISDTLIGFHALAWMVYASFLLGVFLGSFLNSKSSYLAFLGTGITSSLIFYLITNFGVWVFQDMYPRTLEGLFTCYLAAIPFLKNMLAGDVFYLTILIGALKFSEKKFPMLQENYSV